MTAEWHFEEQEANLCPSSMFIWPCAENVLSSLSPLSKISSTFISRVQLAPLQATAARRSHWCLAWHASGAFERLSRADLNNGLERSQEVLVLDHMSRLLPATATASEERGHLTLEDEVEGAVRPPGHQGTHCNGLVEDSASESSSGHSESSRTVTVEHTHAGNYPKMLHRKQLKITPEVVLHQRSGPHGSRAPSALL